MVAGIVAGLTNAALAVISKVCTQKMFEQIIEKLTVALLRKAAQRTTNKVDDTLVDELEKRFR